MLLVLAGAVTGAIGTVAHQGLWTVGSVGLPLPFVAAVVAVAALMVGARLVAGSRRPAICLAVGIVGTIVLFAGRSAGGSVLIPAGALGEAWVFTPPVLCALIVLWPKLPARRQPPAAA